MKKIGLCIWLASALLAAAEDSTLRLALILDQEEDIRGSAIEFRRLAMDEKEASERAAYYWTAAYQYHRIAEDDVADRLLDQAEDADGKLGVALALLRADSAWARKQSGEALFYWQGVLRQEDHPDAQRLAGQRLAAMNLRQGDTAEARRLLLDMPSDQSRALKALEEYERGRDKSVRLGGWLGAVPGLGYAYAGEYANALRSLILNALFIYGMVDTAENDHWGGFAVITFFEVTWYTGSIYGGVDSTLRYNRQRLDRAVEGVEGVAHYEPQWDQLPALKLRYRF